MMGWQRTVRQARGPSLFGEMAYSVHIITNTDLVQEEKWATGKIFREREAADPACTCVTSVPREFSFSSAFWLQRSIGMMGGEAWPEMRGGH